MLSQEDRRQLAELERQLRAQDPEFVRRMSAPRPRVLPVVMILVCVLDWAATAVTAIVGWWAVAAVTGAMAVVCTGTLAYVLRHPN
jgi:fatty acid desaturase